MAIKLRRLKVGHPEPLRAPVDQPNSWKPYTVLIIGPPDACQARHDICQLDNKDAECARKTLRHFIEVAVTGQPLEAHYDEKQCHEAHSYTRGHSNHKIFRLWGTGKIRVYFIYLTDKRIAILKIAPKRSDKLSAGEKKALEDIAKSVLDEIDSVGIEAVLI